MSLFDSLGCVTCHSGPNFSAASVFDNRAPKRIFPVIPTPLEEEYDLLEKGDSESGGARPAWRVPSLRNVALTGPWLHNGSVNDLTEVVRIMAAAQLGWSGHYLRWAEPSRTLKEINRPMPSDQQIADVVAFLHALSSDRLVDPAKKAPESDLDPSHFSIQAPGSAPDRIKRGVNEH
jgi:cytochrome c peroxidase